MTERENVTPMRPGQEALKPRARALLSAAFPAGDLRPRLDLAYTVKGWLHQGGLSVTYGPPNVGKSFLALDMAHHVSKGRAWGGRRTVRTRVLYIAAEGGGSFANRVTALDDPEFWVLTVPLALVGKGSDAQALSETVMHMTEVGGGPFGLIVVDTLARVMGAGDENAAPDIADLIAGLDRLRDATGAHVMLIHHSGKDLARGARGHSALKAAVDTEIVLSRDDDTGIITALLDKQRDGPTGLKFHYRLRQVEIGIDRDGDPVTTCVVEPGESAEAGRAVHGPSLVAMETLDRLIAETGQVVPGPTHPGGKAVPLDDWRAACEAAGLTRSAEKDSIRKAFNRARKDLEDKRLVCIRDGFVWKVEG